MFTHWHTYHFHATRSPLPLGPATHSTFPPGRKLSSVPHTLQILSSGTLHRLILFLECSSPNPIPPGNPYSLSWNQVRCPLLWEAFPECQGWLAPFFSAPPRRPGIEAWADPVPSSVHASVALDPCLWPGCGQVLVPFQAEPWCGSQHPACWTPTF